MGNGRRVGEKEEGNNGEGEEREVVPCCPQPLILATPLYSLSVYRYIGYKMKSSLLPFNYSDMPRELLTRLCKFLNN